MRRRFPLGRLLASNAGSGTAEFALCALVLFAFIFSSINASMLGYSAVSLHSTVEAAARCRAMGTTCSDATTTQNYATGIFHKISGQAPSFVSSAQTCGNQVIGTLNYNFNFVLATRVVPLSAKACFPS